MMVIVNCLLLVAGAVSAVFGISFYLRNKDTDGNMRTYILMYGLLSTVWCTCYGLIGIMDDFTVCEILRKPGVFAVEAFYVTETFLGTKMCRLKKVPALITRVAVVLFNLSDFFIYSVSGIDIFERRGNWTTWYANPEMSFNRNWHSFYAVVMTVLLLVLWHIWFRKSRTRRERRFLYLFFVANILIFVFCTPDMILPLFGLPGVSTSGFGAALCTITIWYGATQLNSFDIRMGNLTEKLFGFIDAGIIAFDTDQKMVMINRYADQCLHGIASKESSITD